MLRSFVSEYDWARMSEGVGVGCAFRVYRLLNVLGILPIVGHRWLEMSVQLAAPWRQVAPPALTSDIGYGANMMKCRHEVSEEVSSDTQKIR